MPDHILCVDDDASILRVEALRLQRMGYEVTTHTCADAALTALDAQPTAFDLVLTDYAMPDRTGLNLARTLRRDGHSLPVVLMSGFAEGVHPDDLTAAGVERFVRKPVDAETLKAVLSDLLGPQTNESTRRAA